MSDKENTCDQESCNKKGFSTKAVSEGQIHQAVIRDEAGF
jgi:hypothetical protein